MVKTTQHTLDLLEERGASQEKLNVAQMEGAGTRP